MIATIIPAYNEPPERVLEAVKSARACSDLVIVADDGSRMPIGIESDGLTIVRQVNKGPSAAMNLGADEAICRGATLLMRLDVGDTFRADERKRQIASMTGAASCSPHFDLVESKAFEPLPHWRRAIYWDGAFCICSMIVSADAWRTVGGFDESLRYGDDWDFAMKVEHAIGWQMYPEVTCEAGAFPGGHTKGAEANPVKKQRKHDDMMRVMARGRALRGRP